MINQVVDKAVVLQKHHLNLTLINEEDLRLIYEEEKLISEEEQLILHEIKV
tara:strand:- start:854 stop:1006 length:153 start_codon:yes stop_codon:yes gene_type:complete